MNADFARRIQIIDQRRQRCVDCAVPELARPAETSSQIDLLLTKPTNPGAAP